jgi:hypothetical protein
MEYILQTADVFDTNLDNTIPNENLGSSTGIIIGEHSLNATSFTRGLIKFGALSTIIPKNRNVSAASLFLYHSYREFASNTRVFNVYPCLRDWVESEATWNSWKTGSAWTSAGCGGAGTDYENTVMASKSIAYNESYGFKEWVLDTDYIFELINGIRPNYGFFMRSVTESNDQHAYHSTQSATEAYRPKLIFTLEDAGSSIVIL